MPVHAPQEDLLVLVLEGEVEGLGGEVTDHVGQVTPPEGEKALLLGDSHHTINDPFVLLLGTDLFAGMLDLRGDGGEVVMEGGEDWVRMARAEGEGKRTGANERLQLFEFLS